MSTSIGKRKKTEIIQRDEIRTNRIVKMIKEILKRRKVFAAKLQHEKLLLIQVKLRKMLLVVFVRK